MHDVRVEFAGSIYRYGVVGAGGWGASQTVSTDAAVALMEIEWRDELGFTWRSFFHPPDFGATDRIRVSIFEDYASLEYGQYSGMGAETQMTYSMMAMSNKITRVQQVGPVRPPVMINGIYVQ